MKFGLNCNDALGHHPKGSDYLRLGRALEQLGYNSFWIGDHILIPTAFDKGMYPYPGRGFGFQSGWPDPFVVCGAVAAVTTTLRVGTAVSVVPYRQPAPLAQAVATVDVISDGRFAFGVGVGWMREEFEALGVPFEDRGARGDDALRIIKSLLAGEVPSFDSRFFAMPDGRLSPQPVRKPHPPFIIGGEGPPAWRRIAALGNGLQGAYKPPARFREELDALRPLMEARGRRIEELDISMGEDPDYLLAHQDEIAEFVKLGVTEIVLTPRWEDSELALREIERLAPLLRAWA